MNDFQLKVTQETNDYRTERRKIHTIISFNVG
jgi:hypothetical protein